MIGVLVNAVAVLIGGSMGLLVKRGIPESIADAVMKAIGLCILCMGITGILKGNNTMVLILSFVLGTIAGTLLDVDGALNRLGAWAGKRFASKDGSSQIAQGFVSASLIMCVGAMGILGSMDAGLTGNNSILYTKSILDFTTGILLAMNLGAGVLLAAFSLLVYQGGIALFAQALQPVLSDLIIAELTCAGSAMMIALALNLMGITKLKVANLLPALLFVPVFTVLLPFLGL